MHPQIIVNLKAYREASGRRALEIAKAAEKAYRETGVLVAVAPNVLDAALIAGEVEIPVYVQHLDPYGYGPHTGSLVADMLLEYGIAGSIINHSEKKVPLYHLSAVIDKIRGLGLVSVACAQTPVEALAVAALKPSIVAVEPPELIGTGISVSKAKPEVITSSVSPIHDHFPSVLVYCGAGITTAEDVGKALELGAKGVLLASAVAKSRDPLAKLKELSSPFKQ